MQARSATTPRSRSTVEALLTAASKRSSRARPGRSRCRRTGAGGASAGPVLATHAWRAGLRMASGAVQRQALQDRGRRQALTRCRVISRPRSRGLHGGGEVTLRTNRRPRRASRQALPTHKEAVRSWVPRVRRVLEDEFAAQLERLPQAERQHARRQDAPARRAVVVHAGLEALIARDSIAEGSTEHGYENVRRELAYTLLNRLVGIKAMEARQLLYLPPPAEPNGIPEQTEVITPVQGQARSRYLRDYRTAGGAKYKYDDDAAEKLLRDGSTAAFRPIPPAIRVLFYPHHEYACIWPTRDLGGRPQDDQRGCRGRLPRPDFLGWVCSSSTARKKRVRDENRGHRAHPTAGGHQPVLHAVVVVVLVDNTLGRLWLQMHPDSVLFPRCRLPGERGLGRAGGGLPGPAHRQPHPLPAADRRRRSRRSSARRTSRCSIPPRNVHSGSTACPRHVPRRDRACRATRVARGTIHPRASRYRGRHPRAQPLRRGIDPRAIQRPLSLLLTARRPRSSTAIAADEDPSQQPAVANAVDLGAERLRALVDHIGQVGAAELRQRLFKTIWENLSMSASTAAFCRSEGVGECSDWSTPGSGRDSQDHRPQGEEAARAVI